MPRKELEGDDGSRAVANYDGSSFGREVLDDTDGVVCVSLKALRIVLRAGRVALGEASSRKGMASVQLLMTKLIQGLLDVLEWIYNFKRQL